MDKLYKNMKMVKLTLVRSLIGRSESQRQTITALGLKKLNSSVVKESTPQILGMIKAVQHLIKVEEV
jgi:large subunit ribosomal protein L30